MKKKFFISLFIIAVIGLGIFFHLMLQHNKSYEAQTNLQAPIEIPDESIVRGLDLNQIEKPVVAMFYVDWCGYCRRFMPLLGDVAKLYEKDFTFAVINCDYPENRKLLEEYNINHFPTVYIIDKDLDFYYEIGIAGFNDVESFVSELKKQLKLRSKLNIKKLKYLM